MCLSIGERYRTIPRFTHHEIHDILHPLSASKEAQPPGRLNIKFVIFAFLPIFNLPCLALTRTVAKVMNMLPTCVC